MQKKEDVKMMFENFMTTQKNLFSDIEKTVLSDENKQMLTDQKVKLKEQIDSYTQEGQKLLRQIQESEQYKEHKEKAQGLFAQVKRVFRALHKVSKIFKRRNLSLKKKR